MADNKNYYYIRLKDNFFDSDSLILMENMPDGILYSNILLKMYLKSLKHNGKLMLNECIPYDTKMIATITRHQVGTVEKAIKIFNELGLVDILNDGVIYMSDIELMIGKSSTEADRKRLARKKLSDEKLLTGHLSDISTPEIDTELELEKELEKDIDIEKEKKKNNVVEVVDKYFDDNELNYLYLDYLQMRKEKKAKATKTTINKQIKMLSNLPIDEAKAMVNNSIINGWTGLFKEKQNKISHKDKMDTFMEV